MNKGKLLILFISILILGLLVWQYTEFSNVPNISNLTYQPTDGADEIPINWRYTAVKFSKEYSKEQLEKYLSVRVTPEFSHNVYSASQKDLYRKSFENTKKDIEYENLWDELAGVTSENELIIERSGESYNPDTTYAIVVSPKQSNIFSFFLTKPAVMTFKTDSGTTDEWNSRVEKINSLLGSKIITDEINKGQEQMRQKCPIQYLFAKYDLSIETDEFEVAGIVCDFVFKKSDTGEQVDVFIKSKDFAKGQGAFRKWLQEEGFTEGPRVRLNFVHRPTK